jgi:peptide/nickel transport system ATP-binding protein
MSDTTLSVEHLTVDYEMPEGRRLALDDVSLEVGKSEILGIVGESGCGKSTLGMAILRLLPSNGRIVSGTVTLEGRDLGALSREQMRAVRGGEIAVIFQDPTTSLNPRLTIGTQLLQVQKAHAGRRSPPGSPKANAIEKLAEVGLPNAAQAFDRYPHEFSGGMRQRVMIAMALLFEPRVIIADEATSALDVTLEAQILELLLRLRDDHGTSLLFISHDLSVVSQLCDRVAVMYAGRVVENVAGEAVLAAPLHPYSQALQAAMPNRRSRGQRLAAIGGRVPDMRASVPACSFAPRCIYAQDECSQMVPELYPHDSGSVRCFAYDPSIGDQWAIKPTTAGWRERAGGAAVRADEPGVASASGALLLLSELQVYFGGSRSRLTRRHKAPVRAVDGVSLTVDRGDILGIVGESGSGKTTLGEAVVKLLPLTGGSIHFAGQDVTTMSSAETLGFRRRAQMIFQNPYSSLSPRMQVGSLIAEPYEIHKIPQAERRGVTELLEAVGLPTSVQSAYPNQLSGGQARRVGIARALALEPDLVVADEPTAGLDASAAASTMNLLSDLRNRMGLTVVLISHSLSLVTTSADKVCVMYFGQVVEYGDMLDVTSTPAHPYTKALLALVPDPEHPHRVERRRLLVPGEIPSPDAPPTGCRFHPRCMYSQEICTRLAPELESTGDGSNGAGHVAACHFAREIQAGAPPTRSPAGV